MSKIKPESEWVGYLFAVLFVCIALATLVLGVLPMVQEWQQMRNWQQVEAHLTHVQQKTTEAGKQIEARYHYTIDGRNYTGSRLGLRSGFGDLDNFHTRLAGPLLTALQEESTVSAWVNPANHHHAVLDRGMRWWILALKLGFSLVVGVVGTSLIIFLILEQSLIESTSKPWLSRREWASATISCDSPYTLWIMWPVVLFLNVLGSLVWFELPTYMVEGKRIGLLLAFIPPLGWGLLVAAVQYTRGRLRFGRVAVVLDPYPGSIGGQVAGSAELRLPYDSRHVFGVELSCMRSYLYGPGQRRSRRTDPVWDARGFAYSSASSSGTRLDFCFEVPAGLPASEPNGEFYHFWKLELSAALPGRDFSRSCELPVFPTAERSSIQRGLCIEHPLARQAPAAEHDGSDGKALPAPRPGFRVGETLRPGNHGNNRPRSADEVKHRSKVLSITPEFVARMQRHAPAALSRRASGMTVDKIAEYAQFMLGALLSLAALWLWGVPAAAMLLFLLAGAWIGIASEWLKYLLMRRAVDHELKAADADRFVWAMALSLRMGRAEVDEASLEATPPRRGMLLDLVLGGIATALMLVFVQVENTLSELHLEPVLLLMIAGVLALQIGGVVMMAWRHRSGHGAGASLQFQAGARGICLIALLIVMLLTDAIMADGGALRMALTIANLVILGLAGIAWIYAALIEPGEIRWLREHMQKLASREPR